MPPSFGPQIFKSSLGPSISGASLNKDRLIGISQPLAELRVRESFRLTLNAVVLLTVNCFLRREGVDSR